MSTIEITHRSSTVVEVLQDETTHDLLAIATDHGVELASAELVALRGLLTETDVKSESEKELRYQILSTHFRESHPGFQVTEREIALHGIFHTARSKQHHPSNQV